MPTLGELVVYLKGNAASFETMMADASKALDSMNTKVQANKEKFQEVGKSMTLVGGAITGLLGSAVYMAAEQEEVMARLAQSVSNTGVSWDSVAGQFDKVAVSMQDLTKYGDDATAGMLTKLTALTGDFGLSMSHAEDVMDLAVGTQMDLQNAAQMYGRVLNGDVTVLKRYGIDLEAMTGKKLSDMSATEKTTAAVEALRKMYGGFARAEGATAAGAIARLKNYTGDLWEEIGNYLLPVVEQLARKSGDIIKSTIEWSKEHQTLIKYIVIGTGALGSLLAVLGPIIYILPNLINGITLVGKAMTAVFSFTGPVGIAIAVIGALYLAWKTNLFGIQDVASVVWDGIIATWNWAMGMIKGSVMGFQSAFDEIKIGYLKIKRFFSDNAEEIDSEIKALEERIQKRNKESGEIQTKDWGDYYKERVDQRKSFNEEVKKSIDEVTIKEEESINKLSGKKKEEDDRKIRALVTEEDEVAQLWDLQNIMIEDINKQKKDADIAFWEQFNTRTAAEEAEFERFKVILNNKAGALEIFAQQHGMSMDEVDLKSQEVWEKVKTGQGASLTEQERQLAEFIYKITEDDTFEGFKKLPAKVEENANSKMRIDWNRHLNSMADATAERIMNSDLNFSSLRTVVGGVFEDIKATVIGTFRQILAEYISNFIVNMIRATSGQLAGGLTGALGGAFNGLFSGIKNSISSLLGSLTGGGGSTAASTAGAASSGAGVIGGVTALGAAVSVAAVAAPIVALVAALRSGKGSWNSMTAEQRASLIAERERVGRESYAKWGGDERMFMIDAVTAQYGSRVAAMADALGKWDSASLAEMAQRANDYNIGGENGAGNNIVIQTNVSGNNINSQENADYLAAQIEQRIAQNVRNSIQY